MFAASTFSPFSKSTHDTLSCLDKCTFAGDVCVLVAAAALSYFALVSLHSLTLANCAIGAVGSVAFLDIGALLYRTRQHVKAQLNAQTLASLVIAYNEEPLETVSRPMSTLEAFSTFKGNPEIQEQGVELDKDFFYQRARGDGNCFYFSYISGLLHHLVATGNFAEVIDKLDKYGLKSRDTVRASLRSLEQEPTLEKLYSILEDSEQMKQLVLFFRDFAKVKVHASVDASILDSVIESSEDLKQQIDLLKKSGHPETFSAYCIHQSSYGIDVQFPEMLMLHQHFFPFRLFDRLDAHPTDTKAHANRGLRQDFSQDSPIVLLACGTNHFDCLLPKNI